MRIGTVVTAHLMIDAVSISCMGVVSKYDDNSLTARFPVLGADNQTVAIVEKTFEKGKDEAHRKHMDFSPTAYLLRQLTGVKLEEKVVAHPKPEQNTTEDVLDPLMQEALEGDGNGEEEDQ